MKHPPGHALIVTLFGLVSLSTLFGLVQLRAQVDAAQAAPGRDRAEALWLARSAAFNLPVGARRVRVQGGDWARVTVALEGPDRVVTVTMNGAQARVVARRRGGEWIAWKERYSLLR